VSDNPIDPSIRDLIRLKASKLVRNRRVRNADRDDIEQELILVALRRLPKFNASKGDRLSFLRAVVEKAAANLIRSEQAAKRGQGRTIPLEAEHLEEPVLGREDEELSREDLVIDIQDLLGKLPAELRRIAELLQSLSPTETARALGLSRGTVYARLSEIRSLCERSDLAEYLATSLDTPCANRVVT
jgi:RNA polymerase sigma factor (sigma-70 family)